MYVLAAPGQGSQKPGFLAPWLELDGVRERLEVLGAAAEVDLITHGTESDAETIKATELAQPLIVAAGIVAFEQLDVLGAEFAVAGHSVGELTAMVVAGILSAEDAMRLVGVRGRAMAEAAARVETGMAAVLGADPDELDEKLQQFGLQAANFNGGGQVVVAGERTALEQLAEEPPAKARVVPLQTAGAFHTKFMESAVQPLADAAASLSPQNPTRQIYSNRDGEVIDGGQEFVDRVVAQVARPVQWEATMDAFTRAGIQGMVELPPAGALAGLAKRGMKGTPVVALNTPDDLEAAAAMLRGESA